MGSPLVMLIAAIICVLVVLTSVQVKAQAPDPQYWTYQSGLNFLLLSYSAYCPKNDLSTWTCKFCNNNSVISSFSVNSFIYDRRTNSFGYAAYSKANNQIVISFRGTEANSIRNWITDLGFSKLTPFANYTGVQVHSGFYDAWLRIENDTLASLSELTSKYPTATLIVTGHSLGGVFASFLGIRLSKIKAKTFYLYTYGTPRIGNQNWSNLFQSALFGRHFRVVNNRDIVPHNPPMNRGWVQTTTEMWERGSSFTQCSQTNPEDPNCSDGLLSTLSVEDHLNYFGILEDCRTTEF